MDKTEIYQYVRYISEQTKEEIKALYNNLFIGFKDNYLDYKAYIFYSDYFLFESNLFFDYEKALIIFNSIIDNENWINEKISIDKEKFKEEYFGPNNSYRCFYNLKPHRIRKSDLIKKTSPHTSELLSISDSVESTSAIQNSINFAKIPKSFFSIPVYTRNFNSKFSYLDESDQKKWYDLLLMLLNFHFSELVEDKKKEIIINKKFTEKVSLSFKIDKKSLLRELKMGSIKFNIVNGQSVFLIVNKIEYPLELYFPSNDFYFPITENMERNYGFIKKLDVYIASHAYLMNKYFGILDKYLTRAF
jgi:hypothetical protein